jgi:transcriptional regulator with XRE-family HTH domain
MKRKRHHYPNELFFYRRRARLSQKQAAHVLGLRDTSMISRYEHGRSLPPLLMALKLEILYRIPVAFLYAELYRGLKEEVRAEEHKLAGRGQQVLL